MTIVRKTDLLLTALALWGAVVGPAKLFAEAEAEKPVPVAFDPGLFLQKYCHECHTGEEAQAHLELTRFRVRDAGASERIAAEAFNWIKISQRVRDGDMPPEGSSTPTLPEREQFVAWVTSTLHQAACEKGLVPGASPLRRLNRSEYSATLRDLLNIHINAGQALPEEGAGGEGFDNAAETLFLSPIHAEKFLDAARAALTYALSDPRSRRRVLPAEPDAQLSPPEAARRVLQAFLPRAFRRPVTEEELAEFGELFDQLYARTEAYEVAVQRTLEAVLMSPHFLFRLEAENETPEPRLLSDHELAVRLSYFLWGTMPDDELRRVADQGRLNHPEELEKQVLRLLQDQERVRVFSQNFTEQWLGTRALGREFKPDRTVIRRFDSELEGGMKYEPIFFFQELLTENLSILNLIDSDFTYANRRLANHYQLKGEFREQPRRVELPEDSPRGGLLGMAGVLAVSSHPYRTSPVLRGKWVLETILGSPPPPAPPNVPELEENPTETTATSLRARLEQHRQDPTCATCHNRIDPLGFGLENFDVLGRWRTSENGQPIDTRGTLPDGRNFDGPQELKQLLLERKSEFARNLSAKLLGYAIGRGLTYEDYCTVDAVVADLEEQDYRAHALILGIVRSVPFRYQIGTDSTLPAVAVDFPPLDPEPAESRNRRSSRRR